LTRLTWSVKPFADLSAEELFAIYELRTAVFVVEQNCAYQEVDHKDPKSTHVFALDEEGVCIAVSRIVPPGISYDEISIGRVAVHINYRKDGLGDLLMQKTLAHISEVFGEQPIRISAQEYLIKYYRKHGFEVKSDVYLEDDIPHVEMLRKA
jgi:ElaA protein